MKMLCPVCGNTGVYGRGRTDSDRLIILSHPDWADIVGGLPFSIVPKKNTGGYVMQREMRRVGLELSDFRTVCLWPHENTKDIRCMEAQEQLVLEEAKGKRVILLVGAQAVGHFTGYKVSDVNGLPLESGALSAPIIYPLVNPSGVLVAGQGLGELRFGLSEFAARLEKDKLQWEKANAFIIGDPHTG